MQKIFFWFLALGLSLTFASKPLVAVLDFTGGQGVDSAQLAFLSGEFAADLVNTGAFSVLERSRMASILEEQGFQQSGSCEQRECRLQLGQLLGAEFLVGGSLVRFGNTYAFRFTYIDVVSGEILQTLSLEKTGELKNAFRSASREAAKRLALAVNGVQQADETSKAESLVNAQSCPYDGEANTLTCAEKVYKTVKLGDKVWMAENLAYRPAKGNSWCYEDLERNCLEYGRLYFWATAMGLDSSYTGLAWADSVRRQGVCPTGWHVPLASEWDAMQKTAGVLALQVRLGGYYSGSSFAEQGRSSYWWTATSYSPASGYYRAWFQESGEYLRYGNYKNRAYALRCVKD